MFDLKAFRKEFNLTQADVSSILDCRQSNISEIERNGKDLEKYQREALIKRFGEDAVSRYDKLNIPNSNDVNIRIQKIIDDKFNGSLVNFCSKLNLLQSTVKATLNFSKPSYDMLMGIIEDKDIKVNMKWLFTGEGDPYQNETAIEKISGNNEGFKTYLLPMSAMGGSLTGFAEPGVTLQNCEAIVSPIENVDFAITVYGESMAPEYPSGSRILIKKINPDIFIDWGKVYVLDTPNGVVVKEVHESKMEGYISCHSINTDPKFKPFDVPTSEIFGMYRVLMCLSAK